MKTLDEIESIFYKELSKDEHVIPNVFINLRETAREWIKILKTSNYQFEDENTIQSMFLKNNPEIKGSVERNEAMIEWIKHFFDISEDDLK